ncbi:MAG TPA: hypothetical protein VFT87_03200 [Candidatus Saccharimonadales bacterium]|nr:hypothetical protein [Candidatus Saccharimonadales bacterium]
MAVHAHLPNKGGKHPVLDWLVTFMAVAGPALGVPQVIEIFVTHDASGLSLAAWIGFTCYTIVFLTYGAVYKLKPVIVAQSLWLCVYVSVIFGILVYG